MAMAENSRKTRLARLLRPRSIVACGGKEAAQVVRQCLALGYRGKIFPIHPSKSSVCGIPCLARLEDLPLPPDATFLGVNCRLSIELTQKLQKMGAGGVVCYASGFSEAQAEIKEGINLQQQLLEAAAEMPLLGPNCYGFVNCLDNVCIWPDQHAGQSLKSGVALLTQSSNIAMNMSMQQRGLPLAFFTSLGNQAQTGMLELAQELIEDTRITAIGLVIEGITEIERLIELAERARILRKPIVALKVGRSEQARQAAMSHTASLVGTHEATVAAFRKLGIGQVRSLPILLETLKVMHAAGPIVARVAASCEKTREKTREKTHGKTHGKARENYLLYSAKLSSLSCSGGEAALIADQAHGRKNIHFPQLENEQRKKIKQTLSEMVAATNPLDYHTFIWAQRDALAKTFSTMLAFPFDQNLLIIDLPHPERCSPQDWLPAAQALEDAVEATSARVAVVATLHENMPDAWAKRFLQKGIAPLYGLQEALDAIEVAVEVGNRWSQDEALEKARLVNGAVKGVGIGVGKGVDRGAREAEVVAAPSPFLRARLEQSKGKTKGKNSEGGCAGGLLDEARAKTLLAKHGIAIPRGEVVASAEQASRFQRRIDRPIVMKALGVSHKSDVGALVLQLSVASEIEKAFVKLQPFSNEMLVEEQVEGALCELLVGITRDQQFGLMLTIAAGGKLVELMRDKITLPLPISRCELQGELDALPVMRLLQGYRGAPKGDSAALLDLCECVSVFAQIHERSLIELDLNPVIVRAHNQSAGGAGALALDALVRFV